MPHDDYMVADLVRAHAAGLPARPVLDRIVIIEPGRDEYGNPRLTVHNGGFGPDLYSNSCRPVKLTVLSGSQSLASHYSTSSDMRHENATIAPCRDCLKVSENVQYVFAYLKALMVAAVHDQQLTYQLPADHDSTIVAQATTAVTLLELRRKLEVPQEIGGLPPMHPDAIDPDRILGTWWEDRFTAWQSRLAEVIAARRSLMDWSGTTQLVAPMRGRDKPGPDREQGALWPPVVSGMLAEYMATAHIAGYVPWPADQSPGPVFAVPAALSAADVDSQGNRSWASLGAPERIADLDQLLRTLAVFAQDNPLDQQIVAALAAALDEAAA